MWLRGTKKRQLIFKKLRATWSIYEASVNNECANWGQAKLQRLLWSSGCGNNKSPLYFNEAPLFYARNCPISISQSGVLWGQNMQTSSFLGCKKTKQACCCRLKFRPAVQCKPEPKSNSKLLTVSCRPSPQLCCAYCVLLVWAMLITLL